MKTPCLRLVGVCAEDAHAADEHRHFGRGQREQLRLIDEQRFGRDGVPALEVVAETVGDRFEHFERFDIGLLLRGVHAARREGNRDVVAGVLRGLLDAGATGQHDQVGERDLLAAGCGAVERALDAFESLEHLRELGRLVDGPIFLRREAKASAVRAAALVGTAERGGRCPGGGNQLGDRQTGRQDFFLERGDVRGVDQLVIHGGDRVLPDEFFLRNFRAEVASARAHVAVGQLEPRAGEGIGELVGVGQEVARDFFVRGIEAQREVGGEHRRPTLLRRIVRIGHDRGTRALCDPLLRTGGALREFPLVAEQVFEEVVAPLRGRGGPGDFEAAGDCVAALAGAEAVSPAEALLVEAGRFGLGCHVRRGGGAVGLAEGVAADDERDGFFVVHGHAAEGVADVVRGLDRIGIAVGTFGVHVDEAHLHRGERILEVARVDVAIGIVVGDEHGVIFLTTPSEPCV